jgi:hypothetical protein
LRYTKTNRTKGDNEMLRTQTESRSREKRQRQRYRERKEKEIEKGGIKRELER